MRRKSEDASTRLELEELERNIVSFHKTKYPNHKYLKTVPVGRVAGHIITNHKHYWLCLSSNDNIKVNIANGYIMGFQRDSLEELDQLLATNLKMDEKSRVAANGIVVPPNTRGEYWPYRVQHARLLHISTGNVFPIAIPRSNLMSIFGFNAWHIRKLLEDGEIVRGFVYYAPRRDGYSWDRVCKSPIKQAVARPNMMMTIKSEGKGEVYYHSYLLTKGNASLEMYTLDDVSGVLNVDKETAQRFFRNGGEGYLAGWQLKFTSCPSFS